MKSREELLEVQKKIVERLKQNLATLTDIHNSGEALIVKWQTFLSIILPIQMEEISALGLSPDQNGLSEFNQQYMELAAHDDELRALNDSKWLFLLQEAFGLQSTRSLSLEEARSLIRDITSAMLDESFLAEVEALDPPNSMVERRQAVLTVLLPLHMSVMTRHGFPGENGYIQAQHALMEHLRDPEIIDLSLRAQNKLFSRAGLTHA